MTSDITTQLLDEAVPGDAGLP
ncbi:MAG: hypothetical protein QG597_4650, partial [Actinomycetota bacterium]|nr:hypothetical protein [Actinomycetota bacterium]